MRALDRHTIDKLGVPGDVLMESAGRAVAAEVLRWLSGLPLDSRVCCVCGSGNNGGDGLVVARHLALLEVPVCVRLLADPGRISGDAAVNLERARATGVSFLATDEPFPDCAVVVDCVFGTGLSRPVTGPAEAAIQAINQHRASRPEGSIRVVSVDLPSGLDSDTGQPRGEAVRGLAAHVALENDLQAKVDTDEYLPIEQVLQLYIDEWVRESADSLDPKDQRQKIYGFGLDAVTLWHQEVAPTIDPVLVEVNGQFVINGVHYEWTADMVEAASLPLGQRHPDPLEVA
jgi:hydroxyethylthiazole kinase-like uncharacterized protein yjeF